MHIHVEEFDKVSRIRRNNRKIVIKRILPYLMIRSTSQADMRRGLSIYSDLGQSGDQRRRDMLIQEQAHDYVAPCFL
jgi:hypothetical protein